MNPDRVAVRCAGESFFGCVSIQRRVAMKAVMKILAGGIGFAALASAAPAAAHIIRATATERHRQVINQVLGGGTATTDMGSTPGRVSLCGCSRAAIKAQSAGATVWLWRIRSLSCMSAARAGAWSDQRREPFEQRMRDGSRHGQRYASGLRQPTAARRRMAAIAEVMAAVRLCYEHSAELSFKSNIFTGFASTSSNRKTRVGYRRY